jgi:hypothetical protein
LKIRNSNLFGLPPPQSKKNKLETPPSIVVVVGRVGSPTPVGAGLRWWKPCFFALRANLG